MCGIFGVVHQNHNIEKQDVAIALNSLRHRGPDDSGIFCSGPVALGHRRLSIIDTSDAGHQPLFSEDKSVVLVFNGEIYNYQELRKDLLRKGHVFHSHTDSEVLVHAYEEYGTEMIKELDGMFAFLLCDLKKKKLLLARDPYGKKPLFYTTYNGYFLCASELKAFRAFPHCSLSIDPACIKEYLMSDYVPHPYSIYQNVFKLSAGSYLYVDYTSDIPAQYQRETRYTRVQFYPKVDVREEEAVARVEELLTEAIKKRLMSDVPLGVFLSGGLDSSGIVALLVKKLRVPQVKTFCIGFREKDYDESSYARSVAEYYGTEHHEEVLDVPTMLSVLPSLIEKLDEPFADASIIPTYLLCKFARTQITVALGGDGNDEVFAGYDTFAALPYADIVSRVPALRRMGARMAESPWLVSAHEHMSLGFKVKHFMKGFHPEGNGSIGMRNQLWLSTFMPEMCDSIVPRGESVKRLSDRVRAEDEAYGPCSSVDRMVANFLSYYMHDSILQKVDRASMMNSLEVRSPFLDREYTHYVNCLPSAYKMHAGMRKYVYKKLLAQYVPPSIVARKKKGFGIPTGKWLMHDLKEKMHYLLSDGKMVRSQLFEMKPLQTAFQEHCSQKKDMRKEMWNIFMLAEWWETHG